MKLYQLLLAISKSVGIEIWFKSEKLYGGIKGNVPWSFAQTYVVKYISISEYHKLIIEVE